MDRKEAASTYDSAYVAGLIAGVQEDPEGIRAHVTDSTFPRYHEEMCDLRRGRGPCTCNRRRVRAKMAMMKSFYNLAAAALGAEDEEAFPSFGPSPIKVRMTTWKQPHAGGRPTKYAPDLALRIGLLVMQGEQTIKAALKICGVCRASKKNWRKEHRLFDAMLLALEESRAVFPRKYGKVVISPKMQRAARTRRNRYVREKAGLLQA